MFRCESVERCLQAVGRLSPVAGTRIGRVAFYWIMKEAHRRYGVPEGLRRVRTVWGATLDCDLADNAQAQLYYTGCFSDREIAAIVGALDGDDVFIDVGAHVGIFSIQVAVQQQPAGSVIAFEPSPDSADRLRRHIEMNSLDGKIVVKELGLWDERSVLELRAPPECSDDPGLRSAFWDGSLVASVEVWPFDELVARGEVELKGRIAAIKVDVEGSEVRVLRGMRDTLIAHRPRVVVVETVERTLRIAGHSVREIDELMAELGYAPSERLRRSNTIYVPK